MGTPEFAVESLKCLVEGGYNVVGVVTMPDKPMGRHQDVLQASPVKQYAVEHGLRVLQPVKLKDEAFVEELRSLRADLQIVVAFRMLPEVVWNMPPMGTFNLHASLLPQYRGAAPINWAILNGEAVTGVTIMHMAPALDAGDIIAQVSTPIGADETAPTLTARLAELGAELLVSAVEAIGAGTAARTPQDEADSTYAPMLSRELSPMDWSKPARTLHDQVRGLLPWPAAVAEFGGIRCKVFSTDLPIQTTDAAPGTILEAGKRGIDIACGGGTVLHIDELQADGGKRMKAADYLRGHPLN